MNLDTLQNEILGIIRTVFDDKEKLQKIHSFLLEEIYTEPGIEEIPEKYKKLIFKIADELLAGFVCFLNPDTLEIESMPEIFLQDPEEFELITGGSADDFGGNHKSWSKCIEIEPMHSHESYKVMENFTDQLEDTTFQQKLFNALNRRKPFANFKFLVENSDYRQQWFDFRLKQWEYYVWNIISLDIDV